MNKLVLAAAALVAPVSANAAVFTNGSFETASVNPGGGFLSLGAGNTNIAGWTVGSGGVDYIGSYWQPAQGARSIDLSLVSNGSISQTFDTLSGVAYNVRFFLSGNPDGPPVIKLADVQATDNPLASYAFDRTGNSRPNMLWKPYIYKFTATGTSTTLTFTGGSGTAFGAALDNVSVAAVPEPATWAMMILGFGFAGFAMRRRQAVRVSFA